LSQPGQQRLKERPKGQAIHQKLALPARSHLGWLLAGKASSRQV